MRCELCGKETELFTAVVEGSQMQVCSQCGTHGKVLQRVKPPIKRAIVKQEAPTERIVSDYAELIRTARENQGLTQKDFALKITVKESLVHKMETGHYEPPIDLAKKLEKILHIKLITMLEETKECIRVGGFDCDAQHMAEAAVELGLMQFTPYDPEVHGEVEAELGDKIYWWGNVPTKDADDG